MKNLDCAFTGENGDAYITDMRRYRCAVADEDGLDADADADECGLDAVDAVDAVDEEEGRESVPGGGVASTLRGGVVVAALDAKLPSG